MTGRLKCQGLLFLGSNVPVSFQYSTPRAGLIALRPTSTARANEHRGRGAGLRAPAILRSRAIFDLAVVHTLHPGLDYTWAHDAPVVLDATYQFSGAAHRAVV